MVDLPVGVLSGFYGRNEKDKDVWSLTFSQGL